MDVLLFIRIIAWMVCIGSALRCLVTIIQWSYENLTEQGRTEETVRLIRTGMVYKYISIWKWVWVFFISLAAIISM